CRTRILVGSDPITPSRGSLNSSARVQSFASWPAEGDQKAIGADDGSQDVAQGRCNLRCCCYRSGDLRRSWFQAQEPILQGGLCTASLYHLVHTAALVGAPITKHPNIFGGLLTTGIVGFSGTCYMVAYLEDRKISFIAPYGGFAFLAAWASLLF
ncbi:unnamed protein product, partial [Musa textilis]